MGRKKKMSFCSLELGIKIEKDADNQIQGTGRQEVSP